MESGGWLIFACIVVLIFDVLYFISGAIMWILGDFDKYILLPVLSAIMLLLSPGAKAYIEWLKNRGWIK